MKHLPLVLLVLGVVFVLFCVKDTKALHPIGTNDADGDGYTLAQETAIYGTSEADLNRCGVGYAYGWPSDFISGGVPESTNKATIGDLSSFIAPIRHYDTSPPNPLYDKRWDLKPGPGLFTQWINIDDYTAMIAGPNAYPPMAGGTRAYGSAFVCTPAFHAGKVRVMQNMESGWNPYNDDVPAGERAFSNSHYAAGLVYPPASHNGGPYDKAWFVGTQHVYLIWERMEQLTKPAIGMSLTPAVHGLTNLAGDPCFYESTTDHIVDFGNLDFQAKLIAYYADKFAAYPWYDAVYGDDFNIGLKENKCGGVDCSNPYTNVTACPKNPSTGNLMTLDEWTGRAASLAEAIRLAFPARVITVNTQPDSMGTPPNGWGGVNHNRILAAVDFVEIEHGAAGIPTNWLYADVVHTGANIIYQGYLSGGATLTEQQKLYSLAAYLLISDGKDYWMTFKNSYPDDWDVIYETDLGPALGPRFLVSGSLWRRNFEGGSVDVDTTAQTGTISVLP